MPKLVDGLYNANWVTASAGLQGRIEIGIATTVSKMSSTIQAQSDRIPSSQVPFIAPATERSVPRCRSRSEMRPGPVTAVRVEPIMKAECQD